MTQQITTFQMVSAMNTAFGNPQGDPHNIDWKRVRSQFKNVGHEFVELMTALGADTIALGGITNLIDGLQFPGNPDLDKVRDASRDVVVFADGGHHFMGYDADVDMKTVIDGVITRFVKNTEDLHATVALHKSRGVEDVYIEGVYPTAILKSSRDQPDAPKGKFLKSASYKEPVFYQITSKQ